MHNFVLHRRIFRKSVRPWHRQIRSVIEEREQALQGATDRHTDRETGRQAGRPAGRLAGRQACG
jgi:hypothetical protein